MNNIRNLFAHGNNDFILTNDLLREVEQEFTDFVEVKRSNNSVHLCVIQNNFSPLIEFNKDMQLLIKALKPIFLQYCKNNIKKI